MFIQQHPNAANYYKVDVLEASGGRLESVLGRLGGVLGRLGVFWGRLGGGIATDSFSQPDRMWGRKTSIPQLFAKDHEIRKLE